MLDWLKTLTGREKRFLGMARMLIFLVGQNRVDYIRSSDWNFTKTCSHSSSEHSTQTRTKNVVSHKQTHTDRRDTHTHTHQNHDHLETRFEMNKTTVLVCGKTIPIHLSQFSSICGFFVDMLCKYMQCVCCCVVCWSFRLFVNKIHINI